MAAADALDVVGLRSRMDHLPGQLSGGQQQRVAVARASAKRPDIPPCDAPTGAVYSRTGVQVLEVIERCNRELGALTVIVTHTTAIAAIAQRVLLLAGGNIAEAPPSSPRRNAREISW